MIEVSALLLQHILTNLPILLIRDALLDLFTETQKAKAVLHSDGTATPEEGTWIYTGKLLDIAGQLYSILDVDGITRNKKGAVPVVALNVPTAVQLSSRNSRITLKPGDIVNLLGEEPIETTMGRLLLNYAILVDPFGSLIPYINEEWRIDKIEEVYIFDNLQTGHLSVEQIKQYSRNLHFIGHFTELSVPSFTERSLTVDPSIIARRDELLHEHRGEIAAGNPTVMNAIEAELIAMDRASLKGDDSTLFYDRDNKSYEVHRKAMLILGGMVQEFGGKGYDFIESSLEEGWDVSKFPVICNEIRRGSYARAKETAKGGEETKFVIRVFQNTRIIADDCNTPNTLDVMITKESAEKYLYRNILVDGAIVTLEIDAIKTYIGQTVKMRSPMHCHTPNGYCFTCVGELFRSINQQLLTMVGVNISSSFTKAALKSKHGQKSKSISLKSLNAFVV